MATTKAYELARLLADGFVGSSEIGSDQVLSGNLADNAVTTAKIANSAVTADKINIASSDVPYDNTVSGLSANTVKEAIDALNAISGGGNAGAQATFSREKFVATADQTAFTVTDGYDVGYLLVFMNGVLLDQTDFTASDGVGFTLSVGAKAGDEIVAIKLDSFAIAELLRIFNTSASAPDDAVTVDASGNLLVGKTTPALATAGTALRGDNAGLINSARAGTILELNRLSTDGSIVDFFKDGSTVGSIGTVGSDIVIGSGNTGIRFYEADNSILPSSAAGQASNGTLDIGDGSFRFKDLYLSGGVYLGGTGSANKLDDYEEGTWTPTVSSGTITVNSATYTKIGNLVTFRMDATLGGTRGTERFDVGGLPFGNPSVGWTAGSMYHGANIDTYQQVVAVVRAISTAVSFQHMGGDIAANKFSSGYLNISGFYHTA